MSFETPSLPPKEAIKKNLLTLVIIVILILAVYSLLSGGGVFGGPRVDASTYQAVFLSNDQVYFGKLKNPNSQNVVLRDVYYLQIGQPPQQTAGSQEGEVEVKESEGEGAAEEKKEETKPSFNLIKLGNEVHGPRDEMVFNRDHVLFWENLKPDSKVVKAILETKTQKK